MGVGPLNVSYCYFGAQCEIEKKTGCNFKMTLWDAKMPLIILHFRYSSYQKHYFTPFNNYIYHSLYATECKNKEKKSYLA